MPRPRHLHTAVEKEQYFQEYCHNGFSVQATAEKFNILRQSMDIIARKENWKQRAANLKKELRKRVDKEILASEFSNINIVRKLKKQIMAEIEKKKKLKPTIRDLLAVLQYEDTLLGNMPQNETDYIVQLFVGTNGNEREAEHLDRNLRAIFSHSNGTGSGIKIESTKSRLPKDG